VGQYTAQCLDASLGVPCAQEFLGGALFVL
jgi:hypothetical protein